MKGLPVKALNMPLSDQFLMISLAAPEPPFPKGSSARNPTWKMWVRS